ncbi:pimeloyl-[acyl-carrier protein] methyl ester esterase-like isoform X3 [Coffea eugenioides]|uniref:pimeloyl-[acyl-carrier protein] methyl ester esterase-like isoform X3 n=1 Tax=Coffea eugenioides TaxID=49369 RepID=UPI000F612ED6|nr:pimeloyl-[acyl-carrier protein] methyl ester esterase-like isoform X3 [Coffea eugenioides]
MAGGISFTASADWLHRYFFAYAGLKSVTTDFGDGTVMHCWVPKTAEPSKPNLLLLHGFGANAMWQYREHLRHLVPRFNTYVPDLLFFGESSTKSPERTEEFQAQCVMKLMELHGVQKMNLVGISYGGFVGYSMAVQFPEAIEKLVLCSTGVCSEEKDMEKGLFPIPDLDEAAEVLVPQTPDKLQELFNLTFVKPVKRVPSCFLTDFIDVMCTDHVKEKRELIKNILKDRQLSKIPRITQMDGLISFLIQNGIIFETAHIDHMGGAGSNLPRGIGSQNEKAYWGKCSN